MRGARMGMMALCVPLIVGCAGQPVTEPAASPPAGGDLAEYIGRYREDASYLARYMTVDWAPSRIGELGGFYGARLAAMDDVDFAGLSHDGQVDYILLRNHLRHEIAMNELAARRLEEMRALMPFLDAIVGFEEQRWRMEAIDSRAAAEVVSKFPDQIKEARKRVEEGRKEAPATPAPDAPERISVTPVTAQRTAAAIGELRRTLAHWYEYHDGFEPEFGWWLKKPYADAVAAMDDYARYLRQDIAGLKGNPDDPLVGDPIGREALLADFAVEMIPYSPEEVVAIGEREFAWCEAEMKKAAGEMGYDDWKAALEKVKQDAVPPGEQTDLVSGLAKEAIDFCEKNDLVTIPPMCRDLWRLEMISPQNQRIWPFAFYGGQHIGVSYANEEQSHADKVQAMRGNNRHFTRIVTPHELIPGHHLQGFIGDREHPYRGMFGTPFYIEGWCLYWEFKLWDMGWGRTPEERIGMLFWRMHRAARIIVSLKYHLREMEPQAMIDFLVDRVGHERQNATAEVRRFIGGDYSPLYQCGYMIGGIQLRALHEEAVGGGSMTEREFNDAVLKCNTMPIEMVRASVLTLPLTREYETQWRFAE